MILTVIVTQVHDIIGTKAKYLAAVVSENYFREIARESSNHNRAENRSSRRGGAILGSGEHI